MDKVFILNPESTVLDLQDGIQARLAKIKGLNYFIATVLLESEPPIEHLTANAVLAADDLVDEVEILYQKLVEKCSFAM